MFVEKMKKFYKITKCIAGPLKSKKIVNLTLIRPVAISKSSTHTLPSPLSLSLFSFQAIKFTSKFQFLFYSHDGICFRRVHYEIALRLWKLCKTSNSNHDSMIQKKRVNITIGMKTRGEKR